MATRPMIPSLPPMGSAASFQGLDLMSGGMMPGGLGGGLSLDAMAAAMPPLPAVPEESAIEKLRPGSELHGKTIEKLRAMFHYSSGEMGKHHHRWAWQEQKIQAYIALPDYENAVREFENNRGAPPEPVKVIVPYSYATIHAAATFLASVLIGRRPIFPLLAVRGTTVDKSRHMEQALQANIEASKGYEVLWQFIWDSLTYSFGAVRIGWQEQWGKSLRVIGGQRELIDGLKYAGNKMHAIDPYTFFPDPRVPIHEVSQKGDFVFWETPQSKMVLQDMENDGLMKWVKEGFDASRDRLGPGELGPVADSRRRARIGTGGSWTYSPQNIVGFVHVREGTVRLVPKDWGLGDSERSELWKFAWIGNKQIIQAEPLGHAHERHPVATCEPTSFGHEFGSLSMADLIGPFQDIISWLVNSRMENVRTTINNMFIADPARIEMQDLRTPAPGRVIRLKRAAMGSDVGTAIQQLTTQDTTMGHMNDIQILRMLADTITGINDNMRGIQTQGGRRSATESRMAMQAGASRLSQMAVRISSQGFTEIAEQMIMNIQQFMPNEMWIEMTGDESGTPGSTLLTPDMIVGSFNYQISDGSLPYDKMALLEVWKEIMFGIARDPELRQEFGLVPIFEYVAQLGGAKNIGSFRRQAQAGPTLGQPPAGAVPVGAALPGPPAIAGRPPMAMTAA